MIGGGAAAGLVVAYALLPHARVTNLPAAEGEHVFGPWIKIGNDGHITVAIPQCEHGQGVFTALAQVVADELGADWRTIGVEPAPEAAAYVNPIAAEALFGPNGGWRHFVDPDPVMMTGGSSSIRQFEAPLKQAATAARVLLCRAAARQWATDWTGLATEGGFVVHGNQRLRFGELAEAASRESLPGGALPARASENRLVGVRAPRLDAPAKVDGSVNYAGDIRLPDTVFAAIRHAPVGALKLTSVDRAAAERVRGLKSIVTTDHWVAAVADNWWAANRALAALEPKFAGTAPLIDSAGIDRALAAAIDAPGVRVASGGDIDGVFSAGQLLRGEYRIGTGLHAAIEPVGATASFADGKLIVWAATQAPAATRAAVLRATGLADGAVVLHPVMAGGSFGAALDSAAAEQAAILAQRLGKPVQVMWSRAESLMTPPPRPPAIARLHAKIGAGGIILGWKASIATPALGHELAARVRGDNALVRGLHGSGDPVAVDGAATPYGLSAWAVEHHPADIGIPAGWWRSGAHFATCFATESFLDEIAHRAGVEPLSYRIAMLGGDVRLARCLSTVAALGGWQGGVPGSGQGIACHRFRDSRIALMVEAEMDGTTPRVDRMVAAVDCGRMINPDLVLQAIEGGLIFGLAAAVGASTSFHDGRAGVRGFRDLNLPRLSNCPDITVELLESDAAPGGASELAVPVVAPAIANALAAASGSRHRRVPL